MRGSVSLFRPDRPGLPVLVGQRAAGSGLTHAPHYRHSPRWLLPDLDVEGVALIGGALEKGGAMAGAKIPRGCENGGVYDWSRDRRYAARDPTIDRHIFTCYHHEGYQVSRWWFGLKPEAPSTWQ